MTKLKTALNGIILSFLAAHCTAICMDNSKFNELILRPFAHEAHKPTIKLLPHEEIGYGDANCIRHLNEANFKANDNSPLIPFKITIEPNIIGIATQQILDEKREIIQILREEVKNNRELAAQKINIFNKRSELIQKSAVELQSTPHLPWPTLIPVKLLDDSNITLNLYNSLPIHLTFNECQKLASLQKKFEQKPTNVFFTIPQVLANKLNAIHAETPEEEKDTISIEILDYIQPQKTELRLQKKIIEKRDRQHDDLQILPSETLPQSNIIVHKSNYHLHGENGYSQAKERREILATLPNNTFNFFKNREYGHK